MVTVPVVLILVLPIFPPLDLLIYAELLLCKQSEN